MLNIYKGKPYVNGADPERKIDLRDCMKKVYKKLEKCENRTFEKKLIFSSKTKMRRYFDPRPNPGCRGTGNTPKRQFSRFGGANLHFWAAPFPSHSNPIVDGWGKRLRDIRSISFIKPPDFIKPPLVLDRF